MNSSKKRDGFALSLFLLNNRKISSSFKENKYIIHRNNHFLRDSFSFRTAKNVSTVTDLKME